MKKKVEKMRRESFIYDGGCAEKKGRKNASGGTRKKRSKKCVERAERIGRKNASGSKKCVGGASENEGRKNASGERVKIKVEKMRRESFIYIYIL